MLRVQRGEVLREPLAEPLLVVVAPADRLSPPLVRELVRDEEVGIVAECRRIVAPHQRRRRERLVEHREIAGTVPARQVALDHGDGKTGVGRVADDRLVEQRDVGGARRHLAPALHLPRVGFDRQIEGAVGLARDAGLARPLEPDRRGLGAREAAHDEGEVAQRLRRGEQVDLPVLRRILGREDRRETGFELAARDALDRRRHRNPDARGRVIAHRRLRIPEAAAAVERARLRRTSSAADRRGCAPGPARAGRALRGLASAVRAVRHR